MKKIGIILVGYNDEKYIVDCINSLLTQTYQDFEILYWDNNSEDCSIEVLKRNFPTIEYVKCNKNLGFAKANNRAIRKLYKKGIEFVLLLNVDTISEPNMLEELVKYTDDNTVTTAKITSDREHNNIWYAGGRIVFDEGRAIHTCKERNKQRNISFVCGCCMLIPINILKKYGLFDELYYLYYEDTDLSMKWYINNVNMLFVPTALLYHRVGGSLNGGDNPTKEYYMIRNRLFFVNKYKEYFSVDLKRLIKNELLDMVVKSKKSIRMKRAVLLGILDFIFNKRGMTTHKL